MSRENQQIELVTRQVQEVLNGFIGESSIKKYEISISPGSVRGDNYFGIIANVVVTGEDENGKSKKLNLIVKSAPRNDAFREYIPIKKLYKREIYMYDKVFPEFAKIQKERGVLKSFKSLAKYYTSSMTDKNEALIMENMKEMGFQLKDRLQPLNYEHALLVLKEYGKLHALSFALRDQKPVLFQELVDSTEEGFFQYFNPTVHQRTLELKINQALKALDPIHDEIACNKLENIRYTLFKEIQKMIGSKMAGRHAVLAHGDSWVNNILFRYNNKSNITTPTDICLLDWQFARTCSPVLDIVHFVFSSTDHDLRDKFYHQLLEEYHQSFSSFLRQLGSDPEKLFPFSIFQEHIKSFCLFGLFMALMVLNLLTSDTEDVPDTTAIKDAGEVADKFDFESRNIQIYYSRIKGVILDFVKFGYL